MIIFFFPVMLVAIVNAFQFTDLKQLFSSMIITGSLTYLLSHIGRDKGKRKEPKLWKSWGGAPSIQIMRYRNNEISTLTKDRYFSKLNTLCAVPSVPNLLTEQSDPDKADEIYAFWGSYLRNNSRDKDKFNLVYTENTNYGFRRNLWGMKSLAITWITILMLLNYFHFVLAEEHFDFLFFPEAFAINFLILLVSLAFWIFYVNKEWVKTMAFAYAHRLIEVTDKL